jgi:hypothetical protein
VKSINLNHICDICQKPRVKANHEKCSKIRQQGLKKDNTRSMSYAGPDGEVIHKDFSTPANRLARGADEYEKLLDFIP